MLGTDWAETPEGRERSAKRDNAKQNDIKVRNAHDEVWRKKEKKRSQCKFNSSCVPLFEIYKVYNLKFAASDKKKKKEQQQELQLRFLNTGQCRCFCFTALSIMALKFSQLSGDSRNKAANPWHKR